MGGTSDNHTKNKQNIQFLSDTVVPKNDYGGGFG